MDNQNENGVYIEKRHLIISMLITFVTVLTLFLITFILLNNRISKLHENQMIEEKPAFKNESTQVCVEEDYFTIKEFEGKIGVYKNGDFQYLVDVFVFTLPPEDKKSLSLGITVSSEQELLDILSCYY